MLHIYDAVEHSIIMSQPLLSGRLLRACTCLALGQRSYPCRGTRSFSTNNPFRSIYSRSLQKYAMSASGTSSRIEGAGLDREIEETVERIHATGFKIVMFVAGGAAQAPSWLLTVPGASRTVLEVRVPYAPQSMSEILGSEPASYASQDTALALAKAAYQHAANLTPFGTDIVGVGCTCALTSYRSRRGEDKVYVTTYSGDSVRRYQLVMAKGARDRFQEDSLASRLLLHAIAEASGVSSPEVQPVGLKQGVDDGQERDVLQADSQQFDHTTILQELLNARVQTVEFSGGNVVVDAPRTGRIYLPGSFNPLHDGHKELLQAACRVHPKMEGCFELSIGNADKGLLPLEEIKRRVAQFTQAGLPLVVTQAPLFSQKAELFPKSMFVVGYDTAVRLVRADYYGDDTAMLLQFAKMRHLGCGFLVAGRAEAGRFMTLADLVIIPLLQRGGLFQEIPEVEFRQDISSTELRNAGLGVPSS